MRVLIASCGALLLLIALPVGLLALEYASRSVPDDVHSESAFINLWMQNGQFRGVPHGKFAGGRPRADAWVSWTRTYETKGDRYEPWLERWTFVLHERHVPEGAVLPTDALIDGVFVYGPPIEGVPTPVDTGAFERLYWTRLVTSTFEEHRWCLGVVCALAVGLSLRYGPFSLVSRGLRRLGRGLCPHCAYPLADNAAKCPECGERFTY